MTESTTDIDALKKAHKEGKTILARIKGCQGDPWSPTAKPTWSPMFDYKVAGEFCEGSRNDKGSRMAEDKTVNARRSDDGAGHAGNSGDVKAQSDEVNTTTSTGAAASRPGAFIVPALLWVLALIFVVGFMLAVPVAISCEQHITLPAWSPFDTHQTIEATLFP